MTVTLRAAIYARISDDREGAGLGVERQSADCRKLAQSLGWDITQVYVDNDLSAFDRRKKRPAYAQLLADVDAGLVQGIVAWHNDRLHRNARELEDFIDLINARGTAIQTVKAGKYDLTTPAGRMTARIVGSVAQYESETKQGRQLRKALELAEAGKVGNGGPRPFGYEPDRITVREDEAVILRDCYAQVIAGHSLRAIVRGLTEQGVTTSTGGGWSVQGLRANLLGWRNVGVREHHRQPAATAVWPGIVDRETWEIARAILTDPSRRTHLDNYQRKYLLSGFLFCGRCGHKLRPIRSSQTQRFGCPATQEGGCGGILLRYEPAAEHITALVLARLEGDVDLNPDTPPDRTGELLARIAEKEQRLRQLAEAFAGDDEQEPLEFRAAGARIRRQIAELRTEIAAQHTTRLPPPVQIHRDWPGYTLDQQRAVVAQLIDRIEVGPAAIRGSTRFDPRRIKIRWR